MLPVRRSASLPAATNASRCKTLELREGHLHSLTVRINDSAIVLYERCDRDRFRRRKSEIIEHSPVGHFGFTVAAADSVLSLGETLT
jgi:hypothetical protein